MPRPKRATTTPAVVLQRVSRLEQRQTALEDEWKQYRQELAALRLLGGAVIRSDWARVRELAPQAEHFLRREGGTKKRKRRQKYSVEFKEYVLAELAETPHGQKGDVLRYYKLQPGLVSAWAKQQRLGRLVCSPGAKPASFNLAETPYRRHLAKKQKLSEQQTKTEAKKREKIPRPVWKPLEDELKQERQKSELAAAKEAVKEAPKPPAPIGRLDSAADAAARFCSIGTEED